MQHAHHRDDPMSAWLWITQHDAGIRTLTLSPCQQQLLVGGRNPTEALVLPADNLGSGAARVLLVCGAHGVLWCTRVSSQGHNDWIFSGCWVEQNLAATASRDGTVKLWSTKQDSSHDACILPSQTLMVAPQTGVRDVTCEFNRHLVTLSLKGVVQAWDACTMQPLYKESLRQAVEPVCVTSTRDGMVAAGLLTRIALLDLRVRGPCGKINGMRAGNGVRSLSILGNLLTAGYCNGQLTFHDVRTLKQLPPTCLQSDGEPLLMHHLQATGGWAQSTWCGADCAMASRHEPFREGEPHACLTHQWRGARLLMAGGPIRPTTKGCFACVW